MKGVDHAKGAFFMQAMIITVGNFDKKDVRLDLGDT